MIWGIEVREPVGACGRLKNEVAASEGTW
jgi:hypothetical protein